MVAFPTMDCAELCQNGSLFAVLSSGFAICPSGVMVLCEVVVIVFVHAS
jgi:hypothetical protein